MKKIFIWAGCLGFLLYRPHDMQRRGLLYPGDDQNYLAYATSLAYGTFPNFSHEANADGPPFHPYGSGLLAAPFVFAGSLADRTLNSPIIHDRMTPALFKSWTLFGFVCATLFYFYAALLFLYLALRPSVDEKSCVWAIGLTVASSGVLLYAYRRPVFSHVYEFCSVAGLLLGLMRLDRAQSAEAALKWFAWLTGWALVLYSVRYNDAVLAATAIATGMAHLRRRLGLRRSLSWGIVALSLLTLLSIVSGLVTRRFLKDDKAAATSVSALPSATSGLYRAEILDLLKMKPAAYYADRLRRMLVGQDWGLLYTAPIMLLSLLGLSATRRRFKWLLPPFGTLLVNLFLCLAWVAQGSWYGYRYLVFAWLPFASLMLGLWLFETPSQYSYRRLWILLAAAWPLMSMLLFEGNATTLALSLDPSPISMGWINPTYQREVLKTLLAPRDAFFILFQGGPSYVVYLVNRLFGVIFPSRSPLAIPFDWDLLLKTIIIWSLPVGFYAAAKRVLKSIDLSAA